ncbi:SDR family oxidoreductase [Rhodococcus pseudokoreensis]|uniref:SDR family oxidoreductase n=1 Tax=Rhodococcus pseudokoreensis TaxID=2811421 RepID=A0A974W471_9NOCA|nr:SDR family NAD(P)-dependent oxidoreductase [Rhodococcus pseudokoreensis]QSE90736.1 SDR family oxidoreductase [Rhodococcus pseudokoreensis]
MTTTISSNQRVALITGAGSGIGRATAEVLASQGVDLALVSRPGPDLDSAAAACQSHGVRVLKIAADISDSGEVRAAFAKTEAELGPITDVHNNAGISVVAPLVDTSDDVWSTQLATNLSGSFYVLREAARVMVPRKRGAIVNTASELALQGQAGYVAYTATKGGILSMTRSAAAELASWGIRVNAVCPGTTRTPMFLAEFDGAADPSAEFAENEASVALGRIATPTEIAKAVAFLLSDDASYVTGTQLIADGGRSGCFPVGSIGVDATTSV